MLETVLCDSVWLAIKSSPGMVLQTINRSHLEPADKNLVHALYILLCSLMPRGQATASAFPRPGPRQMLRFQMGK